MKVYLCGMLVGVTQLVGTFQAMMGIFNLFTQFV